jgi:LysM domain/Putative peptidoglycan binding domain
MMEESEKKYIIRQGDCLSSIAAGTGLLWDTIWNHAGNAELKNNRRDPNILHPGDVLTIPSLQLKEIPCATEARHHFVKKAVQAKFKMRLLQEGEPRSNISYKFRVDHKTEEGVTDAGGFLTVPIPPNAKVGKLSILDKGEIVEEYDIELGHLDPPDEVSGVQKRLKNLGFYCRETGNLDEETKAAINTFRAKHNLEGNGSIDDSLVEKLKSVHGS